MRLYTGQMRIGTEVVVKRDDATKTVHEFGDEAFFFDADRYVKTQTVSIKEVELKNFTGKITEFMSFKIWRLFNIREKSEESVNEMFVKMARENPYFVVDITADDGEMVSVALQFDPSVKDFYIEVEQAIGFLIWTGPEDYRATEDEIERLTNDGDGAFMVKFDPTKPQNIIDKTLTYKREFREEMTASGGVRTTTYSRIPFLDWHDDVIGSGDYWHLDYTTSIFETKLIGDIGDTDFDSDTKVYFSYLSFGHFMTSRFAKVDDYVTMETLVDYYYNACVNGGRYSTYPIFNLPVDFSENVLKTIKKRQPKLVSAEKMKPIVENILRLT